jgi:hypothetical protein
MPSLKQSLVKTFGVIALAMTGLVGCNISFEHDPSTSVTLTISGIETEEARQELRETLEGMTDHSGYMMSTSIRGDKMTATLSPVSDVDSFVKKINFGKVTNVDDRNIQVDYAP